MQPLTLEELDHQAAAFDRVVGAMAAIDQFCSSTRWIMPAAQALMPPRSPWLFRGDSGHVAMMRGQHPQGWSYVEPLEAMWGLACPLIGRDIRALAEEFLELCMHREHDWDVMLLAGLPVGSAVFYEVARRLYPFYELVKGHTTTCCVASLEGGMDGFLGRRSRNFRKALRRALRAAEDAGIEFEACHATSPDDALALYERVQRIETRSWKGHSGVGIDAGAMAAFYLDMVPRLAARGELRLIIARHDGRDVAYVLGGVCGRTYRGLQFSFDAGYRGYSLGNLCQYWQLVELCRDGVACYDLGTSMEYKRRWAEDTRDSVSLIARKR